MTERTIKCASDIVRFLKDNQFAICTVWEMSLPYSLQIVVANDSIEIIESDESLTENFKRHLLLATEDPSLENTLRLLGYLAINHYFVQAKAKDEIHSFEKSLSELYISTWKYAFLSEESWSNYTEYMNLDFQAKIALDLNGKSVKAPDDDVRGLVIRGLELLCSVNQSTLEELNKVLVGDIILIENTKESIIRVKGITYYSKLKAPSVSLLEFGHDKMQRTDIGLYRCVRGANCIVMRPVQYFDKNLAAEPAAI